MDQGEVDELFSCIDKNSDQRISFDEFLRALRVGHTQTTHRHTQTTRRRSG